MFPFVFPPVGQRSQSEFGNPTFSGWWYTYPSEKNESRLGFFIPNIWKIKNVPDHQPDFVVLAFEIISL